MRQLIARNSSRNAALALFVLLAAFAADARAVTISWTPVGNPGNAADPNTGSVYGAVPYAYNIGTYDVTNNQYVEFLNTKDPTGANTLGLYTSAMANATFGGINFNPGNANGSKYNTISGDGSHPATGVSWISAARFTNWLNNGQANSDTESGVYKLLGGGSQPFVTGGRNLAAHMFLPSANEWYKAAYFNPDSNSCFRYPTGSDITPSATTPSGSLNAANYGNVVNHPTDVGAYTGTTSPYGAFDMGGNVFQWNELFISGSRGLGGGSYMNDEFYMRSSVMGLISGDEAGYASSTGFRVAMIPEPSSVALAALGFAGLIAWGWRRRKILSPS